MKNSFFASVIAIVVLILGFVFIPNITATGIFAAGLGTALSSGDSGKSSKGDALPRTYINIPQAFPGESLVQKLKHEAKNNAELSFYSMISLVSTEYGKSRGVAVDGQILNAANTVLASIVPAKVLQIVTKASSKKSDLAKAKEAENNWTEDKASVSEIFAKMDKELEDAELIEVNYNPEEEDK